MIRAGIGIGIALIWGDVNGKEKREHCISQYANEP